MNHCKTCIHWTSAEDCKEYTAVDMCRLRCPSTGSYIRYEEHSEFEVRVCAHPGQTKFERPVTKNGFGLTDASTYLAILVTAEEFGCVLHEEEKKR